MVIVVTTETVTVVVDVVKISDPVSLSVWTISLRLVVIQTVLMM
jgi:hypothetical protein